MNPVRFLPPKPYRWQPVPLVWGSVALHVLVVVAWWAGASAHVFWLMGLNHLLLAALTLWPSNPWLDHAHTRLPEAAAQRGWVALTLDDGPDPVVTPQVLDILEAHGARASFFCIGHKVRRHPELVREIVRRGHSVENHGDAHAHSFAFWGPERMRKDIAACQQTIFEACGQWPRYFRPTAGFRPPWLDWVMARMGLRQVLWSARAFDTCKQSPGRVVKNLCARLKPGGVILLHDGNSPVDADNQALVVKVLPELLSALRQAHCVCVPLSQAMEPAPSHAATGAVSAFLPQRTTDPP